MGYSLAAWLTHIAINGVVDADILRQLLKHCNRLRILLVMVKGSESCRYAVHSDCHDDHRFIRLRLCRYLISDWMASASDQRNMWNWAEDILSAKLCE